NGRGFARITLGQVKPGIEDAMKAVELVPNGDTEDAARALYQTARCFAKAGATLVGKRSAAEIRERDEYQRYANHYLGEAMKRLAQSRQTGFWREYVEKDEVLETLRRTTEYQKMELTYARPTRR